MCHRHLDHARWCTAPTGESHRLPQSSTPPITLHDYFNTHCIVHANFSCLHTRNEGITNTLNGGAIIEKRGSSTHRILAQNSRRSSPKSRHTRRRLHHGASPQVFAPERGHAQLCAESRDHLGTGLHNTTSRPVSHKLTQGFEIKNQRIRTSRYDESGAVEESIGEGNLRSSCNRRCSSTGRDASYRVKDLVVDSFINFPVALAPVDYGCDLCI
jgi:hypothetical protein